MAVAVNNLRHAAEQELLGTRYVCTSRKKRAVFFGRFSMFKKRLEYIPMPWGWNIDDE